MVSDRLAFRDKQPKAIWRGKASQPQRREFVKRYYGHPLCDVGCNHPESEGEPWHTGFMPASEQLAYRYIVSIEGQRCCHQPQVDTGVQLPLPDAETTIRNLVHGGRS